MIPDGRQGSRDVRPALLRIPRVKATELSDDRARALGITPVSRETAACLDRFVGLLLDWQQRINLIAPSTERTLWTRHIADSLQLLSLAPGARIWADLGSGAGFPGLAIACALKETLGARVYLVETNARKAAFLREAARVLGAPAVVRGERVENFIAGVPEAIDVVTARALAPLRNLLALVYPLVIKDAVGLFPKGQGVEAELTEAAKYWNIEANLVPSRTDQRGRIVVVGGLQPRSDGQAASGQAKS